MPLPHQWNANEGVNDVTPALTNYSSAAALLRICHLNRIAVAEAR